MWLADVPVVTVPDPRVRVTASTVPGFPVRSLRSGRSPSRAGGVSLRGLLVEGGLVRAVGPVAFKHAAAVGATVAGRLPDGCVVVPGLRDPHLHVRATAAARLSVDCSSAEHVGALLARVAQAAGRAPGAGWLRGWGYDEAALAERRPPSAAELDAVTGAVPIVVHHRTGHAAVVNHAGLAALGVASAGRPGVDDDGVERGDDGRPTGLLVDAHQLLARVPRADPGALAAAVAALGRDLAAHGVTAITDATATNSVTDLEQLDSWVSRGLLRQRVHALVSAEAVDAAVAAGVPTPARPAGAAGRGRAGPGCTVLGVKVAAPADEILDQVRLARRHGWPVAIHATEVDELQAALDAVQACGPPAWGRDRVEHAGLVLPEQRARLAASGVAVVSNPSFVTERGSKYVEALSAPERDWLYPVASLLQAGVPVAAASDSPVTWSAPLDAAAAATSRTVSSGPATGQVLGPAERVPPVTALALVTTMAGIVEDADTSLRPGGPADLVVLSGDPTRDLTGVDVLATVVAGRVHMLDPRLGNTPGRGHQRPRSPCEALV